MSKVVIYNTSDTIYITTNDRLEDQYSNIRKDRPDKWQAFIRRIDYLWVFVDFCKYIEYRIVKVDSNKLDKNGAKIQEYDFINENMSLSYFKKPWCHTNQKQGRYDVIQYTSDILKYEGPVYIVPDLIEYCNFL